MKKKTWIKNFKYVTEQDLENIWEWWEMNGTATLWGERLPDLGKVLTNDTMEQYAQLGNALMNNDESDQYQEFTAEVLHAHAMIIAMFTCGATCCVYHWDSKLMSTSPQHVETLQDDEDCLLILHLDT